MNDEPSGCSNYDGPTGAKETFVDGRVVVLDVDHLSWARYLEKKDLKAQTNKKSSKRAAHNKPDVHTKAQIASFCSSLAVLKNEKTTAGDCPSRLEDGRRKALQEGLLDEENQKSAVIFTEYLPKSDDYKDTEYVADAYRTAATVFQRRLVPIYLTCSPEEHQRRIECRLRDELGLVKQARAGGAVFPKNQMTAMTPGEVEKAARSLDKQNRSGSELYTFSAPAKFSNGRFTYTEPDSIDGPALPKEHHGLCIDTTGLTPQETAVVIRDFIYDVLSGESNRITKIYPTTCEEGERLHEEEKESWIIVNEADWTGPI
ncbi:hypothetical protein Sste5346_000963 [Sporothrix stenoceras]|uniref:Uncharacterized protein n=1 Tax=Sporothrix stenoceras TaxID=5173 RepID=A0ABR3ZPD3_9PEZI